LSDDRPAAEDISLASRPDGEDFSPPDAEGILLPDVEDLLPNAEGILLPDAEGLLPNAEGTLLPSTEGWLPDGGGIIVRPDEVAFSPSVADDLSPIEDGLFPPDGFGFGLGIGFGGMLTEGEQSAERKQQRRERRSEVDEGMEGLVMSALQRRMNEERRGG
jgi:hypothetical protein